MKTISALLLLTTLFSCNVMTPLPVHYVKEYSVGPMAKFCKINDSTYASKRFVYHRIGRAFVPHPECGCTK